MELNNKKVTVVGLGDSGKNAAILLNSAGADVWATDFKDSPHLRGIKKELEDKGIHVEVSAHTECFIKGSELVVISPGVENSSSMIKWAIEFGIPIVSEMELGFRFCKGKIIAITGTNGKSTVTTLIGKLLKDGGIDVVVCGNIGNSLCGEIGQIKEDTWVVLEVSSFQLERIEQFKPHISLILNITDDHMDRYDKFSDYYNEKLKVFTNQDANDILILNHDAKNLRDLKDKTKSRLLFYSRTSPVNGAYIKDEKTFYADGKEICHVSDMGLRGLYNVENVLASVLVGTIVGVDIVSMKNTISNFRGLPHRFETVAIIEEIEYIDDSKGTAVDSTYRALESCQKPVILIAGGHDKHSDYSYVRDIVRKKVVDLILIGEAKRAIKKAIGDIVTTHEANDMLEAVNLASRLAKPNSIVLLSPMCSSFDMFRNYKERGEVFKNAVHQLKYKSKDRDSLGEV